MKFLELHDLYYDNVRRFILSLVKDSWTAEDLTQETFVKVKRNLDKVRDPSRVKSWIYSIAYNLCRDFFKKNKTTKTLDPEALRPAAPLPLFKSLEQKQMSDCVQDKMQLLPEPLRTVIVLFEIYGMTHREIAEILSITPENAKVRLHRARKQLKSILNEHCRFEYDERNVLVCLPVRLQD